MNLIILEKKKSYFKFEKVKYAILFIPSSVRKELEQKESEKYVNNESFIIFQNDQKIGKIS